MCRARSWRPSCRLRIPFQLPAVVGVVGEGQHVQGLEDPTVGGDRLAELGEAIALTVDAARTQNGGETCPPCPRACRTG